MEILICKRDGPNRWVNDQAKKRKEKYKVLAYAAGIPAAFVI
jgi:hypothetical protein